MTQSSYLAYLNCSAIHISTLFMSHPKAAHV